MDYISSYPPMPFLWPPNLDAEATGCNGSEKSKTAAHPLQLDIPSHPRIRSSNILQNTFCSSLAIPISSHQVCSLISPAPRLPMIAHVAGHFVRACMQIARIQASSHIRAHFGPALSALRMRNSRLAGSRQRPRSCRCKRR